MKPRRAAALLSLVALGACTQAAVAPGPGEPVATLRFSLGEPEAGNGCPSSADGRPGSVVFAGTLAYAADGAALLCLDRPEAEPLRGTHDGDHVVLAAPPIAAAAGDCTCSPLVVESLEGDLLPRDGGPPGFEGTLQDVFTAGDGGPSCSTDPASTCRIPCTQRWRVTGAP